LGMPWLVYHNPEIDWKIEEIKMTRLSELKMVDLLIFTSFLIFIFIFIYLLIFRLRDKECDVTHDCHISQKNKEDSKTMISYYCCGNH